jgi:hypothetical protein
MNVRLVKFCAQPSTFAICRAYPEDGWRPRCPKWPQMTPNDHSWEPFLNPILPNTNEIGGTFEITLQMNAPNDSKMTTFGVILRTFLNPILPNTNGIGGTFEITVQKDPPNDPRWPFLRTLPGPHFTKHQRNRGNFWNNGPKVTLLDPKPCRFYWYLTQNDPKSALNDPKSDPKLSTCIFGVVQNNEIFAPNLHRSVISKNGIVWKHKTHVRRVRKVHHFVPKMGSFGTTSGELLGQKPIESAY